MSTMMNVAWVFESMSFVSREGMVAKTKQGAMNMLFG